MSREGDRDPLRGTETQRALDRVPERRKQRFCVGGKGDRHPERGQIDSQRKRETDPEKGTETQREVGQRLRAETQAETRKDPQNPKLGGQGRPAIRRARTKGPGVPSPSFPQPPSGEGLDGEGASPLAPGPAPSLPSPCALGLDPTQVPSDFPEAGNREKLFPIQLDPASQAAPRLPQFSQDPRVQVPIPLLPRTPEPRPRQRPQAEPSGAEAFRTPVGQNPSPALPHVARQRDGGAG